MILAALIDQAQEYTTHRDDVDYIYGTNSVLIVDKAAGTKIPWADSKFSQAYITLEGETIRVEYSNSRMNYPYIEKFHLLYAVPTTIAWHIAFCIARITKDK